MEKTFSEILHCGGGGGCLGSPQSFPILPIIEVSSSHRFTFTIPYKFSMGEIWGLLPGQSGITSVSLLVIHSFNFSSVTGGAISLEHFRSILCKRVCKMVVGIWTHGAPFTVFSGEFSPFWHYYFITSGSLHSQLFLQRTLFCMHFWIARMLTDLRSLGFFFPHLLGCYI